MQSLRSKNTLRPGGSCQGPPHPLPAPPGLAASTEAERPSTCRSVSAGDPGGAGRRRPGVGSPSRDPTSAQHAERGLLSLCPRRDFCLSLRRPLLLSSLLSAAPPPITMATAPARRAQAAGSPSQGLEMM